MKLHSVFSLVTPAALLSSKGKIFAWQGQLPLDLPPPNAPATGPATAMCACHSTCHRQMRLPLDSRHEAKLWLARRFGAARAIMDLKGEIKQVIWQMGK